MDTISIVIPVYNCEKYIAKCIKSVQKQTYQNWNLILVDDGSTDRSGAICDAYVRGGETNVSLSYTRRTKAASRHARPAFSVRRHREIHGF